MCIKHHDWEMALKTYKNVFCICFRDFTLFKRKQNAETVVFVCFCTPCSHVPLSVKTPSFSDTSKRVTIKSIIFNNLTYNPQLTCLLGHLEEKKD